MTPPQARTLTALALAASAIMLTGCLKRTISITTEPPGALVWLNDVEVGRTPLETDFTFYGRYDVRIRREGYEPIVTSSKANVPPWELPGVDLVSEAVPARLHNVVRWHWDLVPRVENAVDKPTAEAEILARARDMRMQALGQSAPTPAVSSSSPAPVPDPVPATPGPAEPAPSTP